jgi:prefoldin subunit 5
LKPFELQPISVPIALAQPAKKAALQELRNQVEDLRDRLRQLEKRLAEIEKCK